MCEEPRLKYFIEHYIYMCVQWPTLPMHYNLTEGKQPTTRKRDVCTVNKDTDYAAEIRAQHIQCTCISIYQHACITGLEDVQIKNLSYSVLKRSNSSVVKPVN